MAPLVFAHMSTPLPNVRTALTPRHRTVRQAFEVSFSYPVVFTHDLFAPANPILRETVGAAGRPSRVLAVVEQEVARRHPRLVGAIAGYAMRHPDALALAAPPLVLPGGEAAKYGDGVVRAVLEAVDAHRICRHSYVLAVGGGALIDAVGYAAAIAHRGVRLVRVPTTVLAQNDAAVGVKNGVNAFGKKNFVGTFAPPAAVVNDAVFLTTLEDRDWRSGLAEAVKVGLLRDPVFVEFLEQSAPRLLARDLGAMEHAVARCAELHLEHIATAGDPFELGSSRPLDFGHWAAHKLEQLSEHRLRHGEAVAIGLALDVVYSALAGLLAPTCACRVLDLLEALGLPRWADELELEDAAGRRRFLDGLDEFREHLGGELTVMLLEGIGRGVEVHEIDEDLVLRSAAFLAAQQTARIHGRTPCSGTATPVG